MSDNPRPTLARETAAVPYSLLGDVGKAEQILGAIKRPESRTWPLWNLTHFLASKRRLQEAVDIAHQKNSRPRVYALLGTAVRATVSGILSQDHMELVECLHQRLQEAPSVPLLKATAKLGAFLAQLPG